MRLPKQKLPKQIQKHTQTVKHKKSAKKAERIALKIAKAEIKKNDENVIEMSEINDSNQDNTDSNTNTTINPNSINEAKLDAKYERKKANASKNAYKRIIQSTKYFK
mmetsp:Transcript_23038/g.23686  ORF Transcript_23038/g.23686 Transcript_23038/m.23686 type:complete len:107 (+) Transcript_23038:22-342(+)